MIDSGSSRDGKHQSVESFRVNHETPCNSKQRPSGEEFASVHPQVPAEAGLAGKDAGSRGLILAWGYQAIDSSCWCGHCDSP